MKLKKKAQYNFIVENYILLKLYFILVEDMEIKKTDVSTL